MREIKFRAWDETEKQMLHDIEILHLSSGKSQRAKDNWDWYKRERILMQYTGLTDKNGTEIYEGDIVKQTYHAEIGHTYNGTDESFDGYHIGPVMIIASKGACLKNQLNYSEETDETTRSNQYKNVAGYRCEIIGNIYKNPELMEDK